MWNNNVYYKQIKFKKTMKTKGLLLAMATIVVVACSNETEESSVANLNDSQNETTSMNEVALAFANSLISSETGISTRANQLSVKSTTKIVAPFSEENATRGADDNKEFYTVSLSNHCGSVLMMRTNQSVLPLAYFQGEESIHPDILLNDSTSDLSYLVSYAMSAGEETNLAAETRAYEQSWTIVRESLPKCKTNWHQNSPYNEKCVDKKGDKIAAGCIAIAGAQALSVLRPNMSFISDWPMVCLDGEDHAYLNEIQTLIYNVGIGAGLDYYNNKTGKLDLDDLIKYFKKYNIVRCKKEYILDVIDSFHGVAIATGYRARHGWIKRHYYDGHAFLLDGYAEFDKKDNRFYMHINYGYKGNKDANKRVYVLNADGGWDDNIVDTADQEMTKYPFKLKFYPFARSTEAKSWWIEM
jgi:hypothetical protein